MSSTVYVRGETYDIDGWQPDEVDALSRAYIDWQGEKGNILDAGSIFGIRQGFWRAAGLYGEPSTISGTVDSGPGFFQTISANFGKSLSTVQEGLSKAADAAPAFLGHVEGTTKAAAIIVVALAAIYVLGPGARAIGKRL